jgi:hypothetical protein
MPDYLAIICMAFLAFWLFFIVGWTIRNFYRRFNPKDRLSAEDLGVDVISDSA